jgi:hypothetical protein
MSRMGVFGMSEVILSQAHVLASASFMYVNSKSK